MSSNFEETQVYPCDYQSIILFFDDPPMPLNTNPDPFIHFPWLWCQTKGKVEPDVQQVKKEL